MFLIEGHLRHHNLSEQLLGQHVKKLHSCC